MSTVNPAAAKAIARRAVGYQQKVVATKTLGFTFIQTFWVEDKIGGHKSEPHHSSAFVNRLVCGFQHSDHTQAGFAVVHRSFIVGNAVDKIGEFTS